MFITYAVVASCVELLFVAGVVPKEILLSVVVPPTVNELAIVVAPPIFVLPTIPTPPLTVNAPVVVDDDAAPFVIFVTPLILVAASDDALTTTTLSIVFTFDDATVIPPLKLARPPVLDVPVVFNDPPTYTSLAIPAPPLAIIDPVDTEVAFVLLLVTNAPVVFTRVTAVLPSTILFDVEFVAPFPIDDALITPSAMFALLPIAVLLLPVVLDDIVLKPTPTLLLPVPMFLNAYIPTPTL